MTFNEHQFYLNGFAIAPAVLDERELRYAVQLLESDTIGYDDLKRGGTRDVLDRIPALRDVANLPAVEKIVSSILGVNSFLVRATLFDKTPDANWKVPWHQDLTIAVREKRDVPGYGPWSTKAGVTHVQPPTAVLERMVTVRIHIDPCPASNGALRVLPGTHMHGRLNQNSVEPYIDESCAVFCEANAGDALVMRPLLLHSSSSSLHPGHRRVLHFDYTVGELDGSLEWRTLTSL